MTHATENPYLGVLISRCTCINESFDNSDITGDSGGVLVTLKPSQQGQRCSLLHLSADVTSHSFIGRSKHDVCVKKRSLLVQICLGQ